VLVLVTNSEVNKCTVLRCLNNYWLSVKYLLLGSQFPVRLIVSVSRYSHHIFSVYIGSVRFLLRLPMKMEQTECFETSAYKIQVLGNHPKERIQHSEQGESLKSRLTVLFDYHHCFHLFGLSFCISIKQPLGIRMCNSRIMDLREAGSENVNVTKKCFCNT